MDISQILDDSLVILFLSLTGFTSLVLFFLYGIDKKRAEKGRPRISEKTLHLWALCGGWPGGLFGQRLFRHKTVKVSFQIVYWLTVLGNLLLWGTLFYVRYIGRG